MCGLQVLQAVLTPERQQQLDERPLQAGELAAQLITQAATEDDAEAALVAWHLAPPEPPPDPKAKVLKLAMHQSNMPASLACIPGRRACAPAHAGRREEVACAPQQGEQGAVKQAAARTLGQRHGLAVASSLLEFVSQALAVCEQAELRAHHGCLPSASQLANNVSAWLSAQLPSKAAPQIPAIKAALCGHVHLVHWANSREPR